MIKSFLLLFGLFIITLIFIISFYKIITKITSNKINETYIEKIDNNYKIDDNIYYKEIKIDNYITGSNLKYGSGAGKIKNIKNENPLNL